MARVPVSTQRRVQVQGLDTRPLRYAEARDYVSPAIQQAGQALGDAAVAIDQIEATYDQADVLNLDNTYAAELAKTKAEFAGLRGDAPGRELKDRLDAMGKRSEELINGARSERAKTLLRRTLAVRTEAAQASLTSHADAEMFKFRDDALAAGAAQAMNDAISAAGTPQFDVAIGTGLTRIAERAKLNGSPKEVVDLQSSKFLDDVHGGVVDTMFAVPDPDVDAIMGYLASNEKDMTPALRNRVLERLQGPLQGRVARSDADTVMGFVTADAPPEAGKAPPLALPGGPQGTVGSELQKAGFSGAVVAGFLGNFDVEGGYGGARGDGGSASGIAQWRHERRANFRRKFGKDPHDASHAEQAKFVVWEMQNPEAAGMSKAQRDAILNASTPGEAAELIDKHYERSSGAHRANRKAAAEKYGGGGYATSPREWDRTQVYSNLEAVAEREGWNPERVERARGELDKRIAKDEGLLKEQQNEAYDSALNIVAEKGDAFRTHMIPRDVLDRMTPVQRANLKEIEDKLTAPKAVEANGADAISLKLMRYYEPDKFQSMNLAQYAGKVTNAELESAMTAQAQMRMKPEEDAASWSPRAGIVTALNYGSTLNGLKLDDEGKAAVLQIMEGEANALYRAKGNKPLTEVEYQQLFRSATREVGTRKWWGGKGAVPRYELDLGNMPDTTRARLEKRLRASGLPVTDQALLRLYRLEVR